MKSTSEKAIIFLSTGLIIFSALLISYSSLTMKNGNSDTNTSLVSNSNNNTSLNNGSADVLGVSSTDLTPNTTGTQSSLSSSTTTTHTPVPQPVITQNTQYINTTREPLSDIKPKDFYFTSVTTDLLGKSFRVKYEDGTYSSFEKIEPMDSLKGDTDVTINRASIIYKFDKNFTDVEIDNNPGDITVNFINDPDNTLTASANNVAYDYEKEYKKRLFTNFGINFVTREEWGAPSYSDWTPEFNKVDRIVVHHTAGSVDWANPSNTVKSIYNEHKIRCSNNIGYYPANCTIDNTWSDIGYNYLLDAYGNVYEGRSGGNGVIGAHAIPNGGSIGISLLGDYTSNAPPTVMMDTLTKLIGALSFMNDFKVIWQQSLFGHRDYLNTECPGTQVYLRLPQLAVNAEVIRKNYGNLSTYRDMIGKFSFGQDFIKSNPQITDSDGLSHVYLVADNIDDEMKLKLKSTPTWSGTVGSTIYGDNVLVYIDKVWAPIFIGEVGISIPGIQFSTDLP
ncbi:MAG: peptidoglycan recognition family protein [Candidatus Dojkabacteria bacterium]